MNPSTQYNNTTQTWAITIHYKLAIQTQPRDKEIPGMCTTINAIESCTAIPDCMRAEEIRLAILDNELFVRVCTLHLAINKGRGTEGTAAILIIQG